METDTFAEEDYEVTKFRGVDMVVDTAAVLPKPVFEWLGLIDDNPPVAERDGYYLNAIEANDELEWSFAQIADGLRNTYLSED